jgi:hypothetical protein
MSESQKILGMLSFVFVEADESELPEELVEQFSERKGKIAPVKIVTRFSSVESGDFDVNEGDFNELPPKEWIEAGIAFALAEQIFNGLQDQIGTSFARATEAAEEKYEQARTISGLLRLVDDLKLASSTPEGEC